MKVAFDCSQVREIKSRAHPPPSLHTFERFLAVLTSLPLVAKLPQAFLRYSAISRFCSTVAKAARLKGGGIRPNTRHFTIRMAAQISMRGKRL